MHNPKPQGPILAGVIGFFDDPESIVVAATKVHSSAYKFFDCYTPYPVHGLDKAQGLPRSKVGYVTALCAFSGTTLAFLWEYYASKISWAHIVGGKPFNSLPAFVPVIFEFSVLLGGIATFFAMVAFNRLPKKTKAFDPSITNNRFAIILEKPPTVEAEEYHNLPNSTLFKAEEAEQFLKGLGAKDVRKVFEEGWFE